MIIIDDKEDMAEIISSEKGATTEEDEEACTKENRLFCDYCIF